MSFLSNLGIVKSDNKSAVLFSSKYMTIDDLPSAESPSDFVLTCWQAFDEIERDLRGNVFEHIICALLLKMNISPFAIQATLCLLPSVKYDIILFKSAEFRSPIALSIKTSLRERYKQADLEAFLLRQIFTGAKTYVVTLDEDLGNRKRDIQSGVIMGINDFISPKNPSEFDAVFKSLSLNSYDRVDSIPMFRTPPSWIQLPPRDVV